MRAFCKLIFTGEEVSQIDCGIIFVDNSYITDLNMRFFGKKKPTDVISFSFQDSLNIDIEGEIYISLEMAECQAHENDVSINNELMRLVIHGILHLIGYDDKTEYQKKIMTEREDYYLNKFYSKMVIKYGSPLI